MKSHNNTGRNIEVEINGPARAMNADACILNHRIIVLSEVIAHR